jgi:hypothetical protein
MVRIFIILLFSSLASDIFAQAKADVKDAKKNFGFVKKGEVVRIEYEIINSGNQPLIINRIEFTCSCTTAEFDKNPVLPGKNTIVTLIFDTQPTYDRQDRIALLHTNDPKGPHKLRYKGIVLKK